MSSILCVNGGSSSLKIALYDSSERLIARGRARRIGHPDAVWRWNDEQPEALGGGDLVGALRLMAKRVGDIPLTAIGHRLVHGGDAFDGPELASPDTLERVRALIPLAPLHLPSEIRLVEACAELWPGTPQALCFDTAFHRRMPEIAQRLPLPRRLAAKGIRRYGFHGLSYEYVLRELGEDAPERTILAHLGAGASLAAVRGGQPADTTMGLTPAGGLMMATRCGDLDPGVLVHLMREEGFDADAADRLVNEESGLLGASGKTGDMAALLRAAETEAPAREAIESFCYVARKHMGAMAAALGGLDLLVFTGGIGENAPEVRARICDGLGFLGIELDPVQNAKNDAVISGESSACEVRVVATNEELQLARLTAALLRREDSTTRRGGAILEN